MLAAIHAALNTVYPARDREFESHLLRKEVKYVG